MATGEPSWAVCKDLDGARAQLLQDSQDSQMPLSEKWPVFPVVPSPPSLPEQVLIESSGPWALTKVNLWLGSFLNWREFWVGN